MLSTGSFVLDRSWAECYHETRSISENRRTLSDRERQERSYMVCKTYSAVIHGVEAVTVCAETDVRNGLPQLQMVGALASEAKEARERVRVAIENAGFQLVPKHVTVNLSPADIRKEGTSFDLAVAISILAAFGFLPKEKLNECMFAGELSLDGKLNKVPGILPMARLAAKEGFRYFIVPKGNVKEAALQEGIPAYGVEDLKEAVTFLNGSRAILPERPIRAEMIYADRKLYKKSEEYDFADIVGQKAAKRACCIAAAGGHHLLLIGPPGSGKTALAKCIPSILPEMSFEEMVELSEIYSVAGKLNSDMKIAWQRPFQAPHHATTVRALMGGGKNAKPGLISLCHHGVLFMDEFTEFKAEVLETMRQPLEEREVTIARLQAVYTYPASFQMVAAMNPCPCGYYPDKNRCNCSVSQMQRYIRKISQPILDRIDMMFEVFPVEYEHLEKRQPQESSAEMKELVMRARKMQQERFQGRRIRLNAEMTKKDIEQFCIFGEEERKVLYQIFGENEFSTRRYFRILKLSRTIADLDGSVDIKKNHVIEACQYCNIGKKYWRL